MVLKRNWKMTKLIQKMSSNKDAKQMTFWEHLDELRSIILKAIILIVAFSIIAFIFKDELFKIVLAPKNANFITYRILSFCGNVFGQSDFIAFHIKLINTGLAEQFVIHMKTAMWAGFLCALPYIIYLLFHFVALALYEEELKYTTYICGWGYIMFVLGVLVSYFLVFPLTFRFLGTYQVSAEVTNMISIQSYMDTLIMLSLAMGVVFEMPLLSWLLGKMNILSSEMMRKYRRHSYVVILIIAAIITPTSDVFTLLVVSLPMGILYEISILISGKHK